MKPRLSIGVVCYGQVPQWERWRKRLTTDFSEAEIVLINNHPVDTREGEWAGHNEQFEFGAYLQLLEHFRGAEQLLLVNDTWLTQHFTSAWYRLMKKAIQIHSSEPLVLGDLRYDGSSLEERPHPFLSSWFMLAPNQRSVAGLFEAMSKTLQGAPVSLSPDYEAFLDKWLNLNHGFAGWHGPKTQEDRDRKRQCIIWEHRLSRELAIEGIHLGSLRNYSPVWHTFCRLYDRAMTRWAALRR